MATAEGGLGGIFQAIDEVVRQENEFRANDAFSDLLIEQIQGKQKPGAAQEGVTAESTTFQKLSDAIPGGVTQSQIKNLGILSKLSPEMGQAAFTLIKTGQKEEIAEARAQVERIGLMYLGLKGQKNPAKRAAMATQMAEADPSMAPAMIKILGKSPLEQKNIIDTGILQARTFTEALGASLKAPVITEIKKGTEIESTETNPLTGERKVVGTAPRFQPAKPQETFTDVLNAEGQIIGQKSSLSGEVKSHPNAAEKVTKTSLIKNMESAGIDPKSKVGKDIIIKSLTKPGVKVDINKGLDYKIPNGYMLLEENNPSKGVTPIPGGPKDSLSGENAGKAQMLRTAQKAAKGFDKLVFNKDGTLDRTNLFNASWNTPGTQGRELRNQMEFGIQGITRIETGAAMPESEVDNTRQRFMPSMFDSVKTARLKINMFREFLGGTLKLLDPTGRFNAERFDGELIERGGEPTVEPAAAETGPAVPQKKVRVKF